MLGRSGRRARERPVCSRSAHWPRTLVAIERVGGRDVLYPEMFQALAIKTGKRSSKTWRPPSPGEGEYSKKEKEIPLFSSYHVPGPGAEPCLYIMNPHNI